MVANTESSSAASSFEGQPPWGSQSSRRRRMFLCVREVDTSPHEEGLQVLLGALLGVVLDQAVGAAACQRQGVAGETKVLVVGVSRPLDHLAANLRIGGAHRAPGPPVRPAARWFRGSAGRSRSPASPSIGDSGAKGMAGSCSPRRSTAPRSSPTRPGSSDYSSTPRTRAPESSSSVLGSSRFGTSLSACFCRARRSSPLARSPLCAVRGHPAPRRVLGGPAPGPLGEDRDRQEPARGSGRRDDPDPALT